MTYNCQEKCNHSRGIFRYFPPYSLQQNYHQSHCNRFVALSLKIYRQITTWLKVYESIDSWVKSYYNKYVFIRIRYFHLTCHRGKCLQRRAWESDQAITPVFFYCLAVECGSIVFPSGGISIRFAGFDGIQQSLGTGKSCQCVRRYAGEGEIHVLCALWLLF